MVFQEFPSPGRLIRSRNQYENSSTQGNAATIRPPSSRKSAVFDEKDFTAIDDYAKQTPTEEVQKDLKDLVSYLIQPATKDVQKVRALFVWIASNQTKQVKDVPNDDDNSATSYIYKIQNKSMLHSTLFTKMCECADIPCRTVRGFIKGAHYKIGEDMRHMQHEWCIVYVDGDWRIVDPHCGSTGVMTSQDEDLELDVTDMAGHSGPDKDQVIYKLDNNYFLVDPEVFIYDHFVEEQELQLLPRPVTYDEFKNMANIRAAFFQMGFVDINVPRYQIATNTGETTIRLGVEKDRLVTCHFALYKYTESSAPPTDGDHKSHNFVMIDNKDNGKRVLIQFSDIGKYKLELWATDTIQNPRMRIPICSYVIVCTKPRFYCRPLPSIARSEEFGPGIEMKRAGITPREKKHEEGLITTDDGQIEIIFDNARQKDFMASLCSDKFSEKDLKDMLRLYYKDNALVVTGKLPEMGVYLLRILMRIDGDKYHYVCNYAIDSKTGCSDLTPYPTASNGRIGQLTRDDSLLLKPVSHKNPIIECPDDGQLCLTFNNKEQNLYMAELALDTGGAKTKYNNYVWQEVDGEIRKFFVVFPKAGMYDLIIFGRAEKAGGEPYSAVLKYIISVRQPCQEAAPFPTTYRDWSQKNRLICPRSGTLQEKETIKFSYKMPGAQDAYVKVADDLKKLDKIADDTFEGTIQLSEGEGQCHLVAALEEPEQLKFLLQYEILPEVVYEEKVETNRAAVEEAVQKKEELDRRAMEQEALVQAKEKEIEETIKAKEQEFESVKEALYKEENIPDDIDQFITTQDSENNAEQLLTAEVTEDVQATRAGVRDDSSPELLDLNRDTSPITEQTGGEQIEEQINEAMDNSQDVKPADEQPDIVSSTKTQEDADVSNTRPEDQPDFTEQIETPAESAKTEPTLAESTKEVEDTTFEPTGQVDIGGESPESLIGTQQQDIAISDEKQVSPVIDEKLDSPKSEGSSDNGTFTVIDKTDVADFARADNAKEEIKQEIVDEIVVADEQKDILEASPERDFDDVTKEVENIEDSQPDIIEQDTSPDTVESSKNVQSQNEPEVVLDDVSHNLAPNEPSESQKYEPFIDDIVDDIVSTTEAELQKDIQQEEENLVNIDAEVQQNVQAELDVDDSQQFKEKVEQQKEPEEAAEDVITPDSISNEQAAPTESQPKGTDVELEPKTQVGEDDKDIDEAYGVSSPVNEPEDEMYGVSPPVNEPVDEMYGVSPPVNEPVDEMYGVSPPVNKPVDEMFGVSPPVNKPVDEMYGVSPPVNEPVDELKTDVDDAFGVSPPATETQAEVDETYGVSPPANEPVDEMYGVSPPVNEAVDELKADVDDAFGVSPPATESQVEVDEMYGVSPPASEPVDEMYGVSPPANEAVDEPKADVDDAFGVSPPATESQAEVDEMYGVSPPASEPVDEMYGVSPPASEPVDEMYGVSPPVVQDDQVPTVDSTEPEEIVSASEASDFHAAPTIAVKEPEPLVAEGVADSTNSEAFAPSPLNDDGEEKKDEEKPIPVVEEKEPVIATSTAADISEKPTTAPTESYKEMLRNFLERDNAFTKLLKQGEEKTGIKRQYILLVLVLLIALYLMFDVFGGSEFLVAFIGFLYPTMASIKAIESREKEEDTKWLTYWLIYSVFLQVEYFTDIFLFWIPFYWLLKCLFLVYCMFPGPRNGSLTIYRVAVRPLAMKIKDKLE